MFVIAVNRGERSRRAPFLPFVHGTGPLLPKDSIKTELLLVSPRRTRSHYALSRKDWNLLFRIPLNYLFRLCVWVRQRSKWTQNKRKTVCLLLWSSGPTVRCVTVHIVWMCIYVYMSIYVFTRVYVYVFISDWSVIYTCIWMKCLLDVHMTNLSGSVNSGASAAQLKVTLRITIPLLHGKCTFKCSVIWHITV